MARPVTAHDLARAHRQTAEAWTECGKLFARLKMPKAEKSAQELARTAEEKAAELEPKQKPTATAEN